ncbi:MAG: hypothetical protein R3182_07780 [Draconibacterium sp.]|nr:hypothetical protein [Draconibacterium sp.]
MPDNKLCCRIFPIVLIIISTLISTGIWYFEEGTHDFSFLNDKGEFFNFLGIVLFVAIIPIGLFYYLNDKEKYRNKARQLALLGFLPAILFLVFLML